jgi:hypothetical protein
MFIWCSNESHHKKGPDNKNSFITCSPQTTQTDSLWKLNAMDIRILDSPKKNMDVLYLVSWTFFVGEWRKGGRNVQIAEAATTELVILNTLSIWSYRINAC